MTQVRLSLELAGDPGELGIVPERLEALLTRARREIDEGLLPSCQIALAREGRLAAFATLGAATDATQYVIWSSTKPIVASAMWLLIAEGRIDLAKRVADYIPEFATNGKDVITVEQVMLHTSGFPLAPFSPLDWDDRDRRLGRFAQWRLNWEPGTSYQYHATSAHWVLADLIERTSGQDFRTFIRERVIEPLGLPGIHVGYPIAEQHDIADSLPVGEAMTPEELKAAGFVGPAESAAGTNEVTTAVEGGGLNHPRVREVGIPGGGGITRAAELALFYQALLHNPGGIWDDEVLRDSTSRVRNNLPDRLSGVPAHRGLGVIIAGDDGRAHMRGLGRTVSPRAFGHGGAGGQIGWADPESGISFAYLTNGMDRHQLRQGRRGVALSSLAAVCTSPPD